MTPQQYIEWGRRIADGYASEASRLNHWGSEYDSASMAASDFLNKSNEMARAFTVPGGLETLALAPALRELPAEAPPSSSESEETFERVYQALYPILSEILDGMWLGEWEFNDSGLSGTLQINRASDRDKELFQIVYIDSQGTAHETVVARDDEEYGMGYESLHVEVKYSGSPAWKIHAFIFRWDRLKMAGVVDHGETEGRHSFYAVKKVPSAYPDPSVPPPLPPSFPPPLPPTLPSR